MLIMIESRDKKSDGATEGDLDRSLTIVSAGVEMPPGFRPVELDLCGGMHGSGAIGCVACSTSGDQE